MSIYSGEWTSKSLNKNVTTRVIFPDSPFDLKQKDERPKTMYLLHGIGGSSNDWPRFTSIEFYARLYNFTIVMADADSSMYANMKYGGQYFDFFNEELPRVMNEKFRLPEDTYIVGQSMGGYGCLKIGLTYPERFKAIGALSPGTRVARKESTDNHAGMYAKETMAAFGDPVQNKDSDDLFYLAENVKKQNKEIPLIIYTGSDDFLFEDIKAFEKHLCDIGYDHCFHVSEGTHMWDYWNRVMPELMEELCKYR